MASSLLAEGAHEVMQKRQVWGPHDLESCEDLLLKEQHRVLFQRLELGVECLARAEQLP